MLKGIPDIISPDLLKTLMEMGHGDEIVLADANYPAASHTNNLIRYDGQNIPDLLKAILTLFPLDQYVEQPIVLMDVVPGDHVYPMIWDEYQRITNKASRQNVIMEKIERFDFYHRTKKAYAIIATGEKEQYANIILKKGVI